MQYQFLAETVNGYEIITVGNCVEFKCYVELKKLNPSLTPSQVEFTEALRFRDNNWRGPCECCKGMFGNSTIPRSGNLK